MTCNTISFPHGDLPPLPQRAVQGLPDGSSFTPDGEPFHTVHIWEFPHLYVVLQRKMLHKLSKLLRGSTNLAALARRLKLGRGILANIRDNPDQSISIPTLKTLRCAFDLDPDLIEGSLRTVQFNQSGDPEKIPFPLVMDIYTWRVLCHIVGDGNVHDRPDRPYPYLRWIQERKNQGPMRELLKRLSRPVGGNSIYINIPKALTYATMGTIPGLTVSDLRSPTFLQFINDLPPEYRDYKVQLLAAFLVDDGCVSGDISFYQKKESILSPILTLCDQLGYDHSEMYTEERSGVNQFSLRLSGVRKFYNDLIDIQSRYADDPILELWHKQQKHKHIVENISDKRLEDNQRAIQVHETLLIILSDNVARDSNQLRDHPKLCLLVKNYSKKIFKDRLRLLHKLNLICEVKKPNNRSYRPKRWVMPPGRDLKTLLEEFHSKYVDRAHPQSYNRTNVPHAWVIEIKAELEAECIDPTPTNVARRGGFSRNVIYKRKDLRDLFKDYLNDDHVEEE